MSDEHEYGYNIIAPDCSQWIPVAGFGMQPTALISTPCTAPQGHDGPHRTNIVTPDWSITIQAEPR